MKFEYEVTNLSSDEVLLLTLDPIQLDQFLIDIVNKGMNLSDIAINLVEAS